MKSADNKRPLKVFLCHAHSDKDAVKALYARLRNDGVDVWLDKENLLPGQNWRVEIRRAVEEADVIVVCHSNDFNQEGFRQREVRWALDAAMEKPEGEIFIIPARLEETEVLKSLSDWHWVDLFEQDGYQKLMRALQIRAQSIGATLQDKKSWFPSRTSPRPKPVEPKVEKPPTGGVGIGGDVKESVIVSGSGNVINIGEQKKPEPEKPQPRKTKPSSKPNTAVIVAIIGLIGTIIAALISSPMLANLFDRINIPTPEIGSSIESDGVTMMYVPAGAFSMGSESGFDDEKPIHSVMLDAYYIDKYEVTNAAYKRCVEAGACDPLKQSSSYTRNAYYGNPEFDEYPVIYVDWNMANAYCEWRGDRLPTEAEWEKAARWSPPLPAGEGRGEGEARTYPWGKNIDCDKANYRYSCVGDTTQVGSYLDGVSPYGLYDMSGNVWEWVADWYDSSYYSNSPSSNPLGPSSGQYRVLRGGSWYSSVSYVRSANRVRYTPDIINYYVGFRCARSLP